MIGLFLYREAIYIHRIWVLSVHVCVCVSWCHVVLSFWEIYPLVSGFDFLDSVPLIIDPGGLGVPSGDVGGYLFQGVNLVQNAGLQSFYEVFNEGNTTDYS